MAPHDMPRDPKRNAAAVAVAVAVLAVVGAIFGYLLGTQADRSTNADKTPGSGQSPVRSTTKAGGSAAPQRTGKPCPAVSEAAAKAMGSPGDLRQRLYIRTEQSEVWICDDKDGRLWYQGHRLRGEFKEATGPHSLFLGGVNNAGTEGYVAVNRTDQGNTEYTVNQERLIIRSSNGGNPTREPVIESDPPK